MFDISKLRKPDLFKDYILQDKSNEYISKVKEALQGEWDAAAADPMTKTLKALAAMDCLRVQRTNETARRLLVAFAKGADLDNIRPDIERMQGGNPIAKLKITYRNPESVNGIIPAGTEFRGDYTDKDTNETVIGYFKAKTYLEYEINPDPDENTQIIEAVIYEGGGESVDNMKIDRLLIASPVIEKVEIDEIEDVGTDEMESDERYRQRILLAPTSNMGGRRAYQYYAMSADLNIQEVFIETTAPGCLTIWVLPNLKTWELSDSAKSERRDLLLPVPAPQRGRLAGKALISFISRKREKSEISTCLLPRFCYNKNPYCSQDSMKKKTGGYSKHWIPKASIRRVFTLVFPVMSF